ATRQKWRYGSPAMKPTDVTTGGNTVGDPVRVKKPRGRPFGPGNQPGGGSKKGRRVVRALPHVRAFPHGNTRPAPADTTALQHILREMKQDDPGLFARALAKAEEGHARRVAALKAEVAKAAGSGAAGLSAGRPTRRGGRGTG